MKTILTVIGTRPEAIKMAPIIRLLAQSQHFISKVCLTGQHNHLLNQVVEFFKIQPDYNLNLMQQNQSLYDITANALQGLKPILAAEKPDMVLVHGDTTTAFAGALAAFYAKIPVGHVEAGLRTNDIYSPYPEEANRVLTAKLAALHFAPTEHNRANLIQEGIASENIFVTGNTIIDALLETSAWVKSMPMGAFNQVFGKAAHALVDNKYQRLILITGHRRENFGAGFEEICLALAKIALAHPEWLLIYPVHLNPNVQQPVQAILSNIPNIYLIDPVPYAPFVYLLNNCDLVITDSGGIQEEGAALGKTVLVMRACTERPEALVSGKTILVGTESARIIAETEKALGNKQDASQQHTNPYGDGHASERIITILAQLLVARLPAF